MNIQEALQLLVEGNTMLQGNLVHLHPDFKVVTGKILDNVLVLETNTGVLLDAGVISMLPSFQDGWEII